VKLVKDLPKYTNIPAFIIGNGISRQNLDLNIFRNRGIIFGCNRLFRDYDFTDVPFFLGANDPYIYQLLVRHNYQGNIICAFTVKDRPEKFGLTDQTFLIDGFDGLASCGHCVLLSAIQLECFPIFLIAVGDDMKEVAPKTFSNNVYTHQLVPDSPIPYRTYENPNEFYAEREKGLKWKSEYARICQRYKDRIFKVLGYSDLDIPSVTINDICQELAPCWALDSGCNAVRLRERIGT
jgi:hypothetical protein